jgi:hypothetical protein
VVSNRVCSLGVFAMTEQPAPPSPAAAEVQARLHELAQTLRTAHRLKPEAQEALANLVDELSALLDPATPPSLATAHLADSAVHLAHELQKRPNKTLLAAAKDRLQEATVRAEAEAPLAVGLARQFLDTLANLGI